ncbi:MAG: sugar transferase [Campylobacteraceae bacterium]|jgi:sugar transferase EpsL|nr:sugar transferase [Campylobacteraceae bacterium]
MKRLFDVLLSIFLLIILSPIIIIVYILVFVIMGKPAIFKQPRGGYKGKIFTIYKFRTMTNKTDEHGVLLSDEERLNSFGKFLRYTSLDEFPQIINVLKGDMSLIGPRPQIVEYLPLYSEEQSKRHDVKPGITGWAQVNGRNDISWTKKFEYDVWYVENQSFMLDMKILFKTFLHFFNPQGVSQEGHATVEKFNGKN